MKDQTRTFAVVMALCISVFSLCAFGLPRYICILSIFVAVMLCFAYMCFICKKKIIMSAVVALVAATVALLGFLWGNKLADKVAFSESLVGAGEKQIFGYIDDTVFSSSYSSRYIAVITNVGGEDVEFKTLLDMPFQTELCKNESFGASGAFKALDNKSTYYEDGVYVGFEADDIFEGDVDPLDFYDKIVSIFDNVAKKLKDSVGGSEGGLAAALALGRRDWLPSSVKLDFRRIGASHILAVSGMHLSVLVLALDRALHFVGKRKRSLILVFASLAFMMITGMTPSVCRAALMMSMFYLSSAFGYESDSVTSLLFSMSVILLFSPSAVFSQGFWLSCLATLGIVTVAPAFKLDFLSYSKSDCRFKRISKRALRSVLSMTVLNISAQMFTLPVICVCYGGASVVSAVSGFVMIPLSQMALVMSMCLCFLMYIPPLCRVIAYPTKIILRLILDLSSELGDVNGIYVSIAQDFAVIVICVFSAICLAVVFLKRVDRRYTFAVMAAMSILLTFGNILYNGITEDEVNIIYQCENANESITVSNNGICVAVDMSSGAYSALSSAVENARSMYHEEIDVLVLTHLHVNHISSVKRTVDNIRISKLLLPTAENENDALVIRSITSLVGDSVDISFYNRSSASSIEFGDVKIDLPLYMTLKRSTHPVIAFSVDVRGHTLSYCGSSFNESDNVNWNYFNCDCTIIGAHGPIRHKNLDVSSIVSDNVVIGNADDDMIDISDNAYIVSNDTLSVHIKFE